METQAHRNLRRLAAAVEGRRPLPDEVADWLAAGLRDYIDSGGRSSLDRSLGLRGAGVRSLETALAHERRNAALAAAMEYAHDGQPCPRRQRAGRLAEAVRRFRDRRWPRLQHLDEPPAGLSSIERQLFRAFKTGIGVPETPKQITACVQPARGRAKK